MKAHIPYSEEKIPIFIYFFQNLHKFSTEILNTVETGSFLLIISTPTTGISQSFSYVTMTPDTDSERMPKTYVYKE